MFAIQCLLAVAAASEAEIKHDCGGKYGVAQKQCLEGAAVNQ